MDQPENKDPVWKLLSHASQSEPGPFFSRNVVREVRQMESTRGRLSSFFALFRSPVLSGSVAVAVVAITSVVLLNFNGETPVESPVAAIPSEASFDPASELEAVEYLGQLMAVTDPAQLSDEALAELFF